ncbi:MAG: Ribosomal RNA small subunit methyltransferase I [Chlamydiales bacterium]|nr:Ribosomal RNA small subunit methyltransferase I [Chlamydiales bacterium]MCH9620520.1 Ribosomal RNA small subunit methyltransferase I [Chlamydiales bacterium]MCH9623023.1 Ribosomal RNA small subunit methyltransferase I [Chlamydiales bacterium]
MTLYLFPNLLGNELDVDDFLPQSVGEAVSKIDGLIAESQSGGRRFLKRFKTKKKSHEMPIALISEKIDFLLKPILEGESWGVVSDAGLPCLADPGALLVRRAQKLKLPLQTFPGPSSITMALILSGLPAQRFTFYGYLSKNAIKREEELLELEQLEHTVLFIESPYRNKHTFQACLNTLDKKTLLMVATDLTLPTQFIETKSIQAWQKKPFAIEKKPTIFAIRK